MGVLSYNKRQYYALNIHLNGDAARRIANFMLIKFTRWRLLAGLMALVFVTTACFQGDTDNTSIGVDSAMNPSPTTAPTRTPDATSTPTATATTLDRPVVERPSETATDVLTATTTSTATSPPTLVAQADPSSTSTPSDLAITSTARVREATGTAAAAETATAIDLGLGQPTQTPLATATASPNPFVTPTTQQQFPQQQSGGGGATGADCVHQVRNGETMWRLSSWYDVPVRTIAARNNITNIQLIRVNQQITIPNCGVLAQSLSPPVPPTATPQPGVQLQQQQQPANPPAGNVTYLQHTVDQYETLFEISLQYNVPIQQIAAANGITNYDYIEFNNVLQIPVTSGGSNPPQQQQQPNPTATPQPFQNPPTATWTPLPPGIGG
jgi:LysM repeat protein